MSSETNSEFARFLTDAEALVVTYYSIIEKAPLQTYGAALVFCPTESETKRLFWGEQRLPCIKSVAGIERCWDLHRQALAGHNGWVTAIAFSPDGKTLASASNDEILRLWTIDPITAKGTPKRKLICHNDEDVYAIAFSPPDGMILASTSPDKVVRLWAVDPIVATWVLKQELTGHDDFVLFIAFSPGGEILASASRTVAQLWAVNPMTATWELKWQRETKNWFRAMAFSPNGKILALVGVNSMLLWATDLATAAIVSENSLEYRDISFRAVAFLPPDGKILALALDDNTIQLWPIDPVTLTRVPEWLPETLVGHDDLVNAVAFSPSDGKILASASDDKTIRLWAINPVAATGECIRKLTGHHSSVDHIAFSPLDGKILASASYDNTVRLWAIDPVTTTATTKSEQEHTGHNDSVTAVAFSPDGKMLASASADKTIQLWAIDPILATGVSKGTLTDRWSPFEAIAFSPPDGRILASASEDGMIRLWAIDPMAATGEFKDRLTDDYAEWQAYHERQISLVTFSPDGKMLASVSHEKIIRLWAINPVLVTGVSKAMLTDNHGVVNAIAFSANCRMLAVASSPSRRTYSIVCVWTIEPATSTVEVKERNVVEGIVEKLSFSEDGGYIKTNRGNLPLSGDNEPIPNRYLTCHVYLDNVWISRGNQRLLWLPPDYRASCEAFYNNIYVLGHHSGRVTFIGFNFPVTQL